MLTTIKKSQNLLNVSAKVKFPEKFKGTIVEKWANYWKNLFIDYRQMLQDLRSDIQDEPKKAIKWTVGLVTASIFAKNNPSEIDFRDNLKNIANEVALVSESCRNPKSIEHLKFLETSYNAKVIHYKSLGLFSLMYISNLNNECDLYKGHCSYIQPTYFSYPAKIVDIGFLGQWWNVYIKMTNFDVNE